MIQLTPIDQTVVGQELIQMGMYIGVEKGELIGNIRTTQRFLKRRLTPKEKFVLKNTDVLRIMLRKLESALSI